MQKLVKIINRHQPIVEKKYFVAFSRHLLLLLLAGSLFGIISKSHAQFILPPENPQETRPGERPQTTEIDNFSLENVRNLRAELAPNSSNMIILTWLQAAIQDDFIIARSTAPIVSLDLLLAAKAIAVVPPGTGSFIDHSLEPGSYYYAVVSSKATKEKRVTLRVGENYTGTPVIILQKLMDNPQDLPPPQVSLLFARADKNQIRLSWRGVATPGVRYVIYRAEFPIATPADVARANQIAIVGQGQEFYIDNQLPGPGLYYYAVATRSVGGAQDNQLVPDQSYTREGVWFGTRELPVVRGIKASLVQGTKNEIKIDWNDAAAQGSENFSYRIYRATSRIDNQQTLRTAQALGDVKAGVGTFIDRNVEPGRYYYAVVTLAAEEEQSIRFIPGENVTVDFITVGNGITPTANIDANRRPDQTNIFSDFLALVRSDSVILAWKIAANVNPSHRLHLYRFDRQPRSLGDIPDGELIAKLDSDQVIFEDIPPRRGIYYYAIFLQTPRGLTPATLDLGRNLTGAIAFSANEKRRIEPSLDEDKEENEIEEEFEVEKEKTKPTKQEQNVNWGNQRINSVIRATYLQSQYQEAITQLAPFTRSADSKVAAKALFYTGLAHYQLRNYTRALDYFVHPKVVNAYGNTARFWYRKTLEHLQ